MTADLEFSWVSGAHKAPHQQTTRLPVRDGWREAGQAALAPAGPNAVCLCLDFLSRRCYGNFFGYGRFRRPGNIPDLLHMAGDRVAHFHVVLFQNGSRLLLKAC